MKITKIGAWIRSVLHCPKCVICARCLKLNFFFDDVGFYPRDRGSNVSGVQRDVALKLIAGAGKSLSLSAPAPAA
jgi:hypothetical protein